MENPEFLLNDTFDNFTFDDTQNLLNGGIIAKTSAPKVLSPKNNTKNNNEISFDDSIFFSASFSSQMLCSSFENKSKNAEEKVETEFKENVSPNSSECLLTERTNISSIKSENVNIEIVQPNIENKKSENLNIEIVQQNTEHEKLEKLSQTFQNSLKLSQSQKISNPDLPKSSPASENLNLSAWGLPQAVLDKYASRNIIKMFPWQVECLSNEKVLNGGNLVYSAPTSAGKTLVAEILALKTLFERNKKVIFILPFVSIVREKLYYFQDILSSSGIRVEGFMGSYNPPGGFQSIQIAICTIEKANSLINKLLEEDRLSEIGAILVDEVHLLGDPSRGYLLELLLTKLKYIQSRKQDINVQIIGMSATLPNLTDIATWLNAELYVTDFRPIPLYELAQIGNEIFDSNLSLVRQISPLEGITDTDNILQLCLETIKESCSVLIFCPSKNWCENLANQISSAFFKLGSAPDSFWGQILREQLKPDLIMEVLEQLKFCPIGLDAVLKKTVSFAVAFHHAGLTMDERDIIEGAFRRGGIRVLIATSTLSSGVNLPARRVIIRTANFHGRPIDTLTYRQMIGRAGRMGKDSQGESILICQKNDTRIAKELMSATLQPVESCLEESGRLKRAILEVIASNVASSMDDVNLFTSCTLLAALNDLHELNASDNANKLNNNTELDTKNPIAEALEFLKTNEFIRLQKVDDQLVYVATPLGKACLSSSMAPEEGLRLFTELEKARQCFVLETELHLIYLVTPYSACNQWSGWVDWMLYLDIWEKLPATMKRVGNLVGVQQAFIINGTRGKISTNNSKSLRSYNVHLRFFIALALQDLVNEKSLTEVCAKFNCNRGMLQSLQQSASSFAGMVTAFSRQLGWTSVDLLISQFQDRLQFGVSRDLLDLMRLPTLNGKMARTLYNSGVESLAQLANSNTAQIEGILHRAVPFQSEKEREGESEFEAKERNKYRHIWVTGREGLTVREAAEMLLKEARDYLIADMGLKDAKWGVQENQAQESINESDNSGRDSQENSFKLQLSPADSGVENVTHTEQDLDHIKNLESAFCSSFKLKSPSEEMSIQNLSEDIFSDSLDEMHSPEIASFDTQMKKRKSPDNFNAETPKKPKLSSSFLKSSVKKIEIINVCKRKSLLDKFAKDLNNSESISLSIAFSQQLNEKMQIGQNILKTAPKGKQQFSYENYKLVGFALNIEGNIKSHYLELEKYPEDILDLLSNTFQRKNFKIKMFDAKEQLKLLKRCCGIDCLTAVEDPKVAHWLLNPDGKEMDLNSMVAEYCPNISEILKLVGNSSTKKACSSLGLDVSNKCDPKIRSCVEAIATWFLVDDLKQVLVEKNGSKVKDHYENEMNLIRCIAKLETTGMGLKARLLQDLIDDINRHLQNIERKSFCLAGRKFSFQSSREVAKVLNMAKTKGRVSTNKKVLEQIEHPLSKLITLWRKLHATVTNMLYPLSRAIEGDRIYGSYAMHTCTGRLIMAEPNVQCVAKNISFINPLSSEEVLINSRSCFKAGEGYLLLSADYCQLELRILAHLSQDPLLLNILQQVGDAFKSIAAKWNRIDEKDVSDIQRQHVKHICYGIIYGMGYKSLAQQLDVTEAEAMQFMSTFKATYKGVEQFIQKVTENCKINGYVETIFGRKRYLPHILDSCRSLKGQAERQAINTTVQGTAADIAKKAMLDIDNKLSYFSKQQPQLVLHLHDELIYEVPRNDLNKMAKIMKDCMENCVQLSVPLPVKLKSGVSWGELSDFVL